MGGENGRGIGLAEIEFLQFRLSFSLYANRESSLGVSFETRGRISVMNSLNS